MEASQQAREDRQGVYLAEFQPRNKPDLHLEASFRATVDDRGNFLGTLASIRDITARKQQELALVRYAQTDDLTGLLNRAGFLQKLGTAIAGDERGDICIALIDMDHFKRINDNRGHQAGDAVLQEIGARLSSQVRATDAVGRLGGDEFVVLMPRCGWDTAREIGNRLVAAVGRTPIVLPDGGPAVTASISCGIARYRKGWTMAQFLSEADRALYEAKGAGRDRIMCA
ncbi:GGDEF domain-containing protein [uncultured Novosphingobium sp.]|uniref:GGDEF domain-containing protein n=1 Tax=uncultured Novosphingobium sp. TaxID=292277 RepID=UPI002596AAD0|nr:GGDEF domain-containing protein [uncultured Novosphingobium sp.]